ncbi:MAG: phosphotransacetylase [Elusimicrobia bacterium]|nr:phosphotransacetylase [Elusimicrobiota bacterium]
MKKYINIDDKAIKSKKIVFCESFDLRVLEAASRLARDEACKVCIVSENALKTESIAESVGIDLSKVEVIGIELQALNHEKIEAFIAHRVLKGETKEEALSHLQTPLYYALMYLKNGFADAFLCGAVYDSADVLRAALSVVGIAPGSKLISSYFLMIPPPNHTAITEPVLFADCAVNPVPMALGLADIAVQTIKNFKKLFPARIVNAAFLSFSTLGSSQHSSLSKVIDATAMIKEHFQDDKIVNIEGEVQFDAAIMPVVARRKAPDSKVCGHANVLIFPDLNSGNIGYKIAERLGGFNAVGPIIQGLALPVSDLSRGADAEDIYNTALLMLV